MPWQDDVREARDPNTPPERLLELARRFPDDVDENPSLELLSLADPPTWLALRALVKGTRARLSIVTAIEKTRHFAGAKAAVIAWQRDCLAHAASLSNAPWKPLTIEWLARTDRAGPEAWDDLLTVLAPLTTSLPVHPLVEALELFAREHQVGARPIANSWRVADPCAVAVAEAAASHGKLRSLAEADERERQRVRLDACLEPVRR